MSSNVKNRPLYAPIQNDIIPKIQTGVFQEGDRIPSENELMRTWNVSRITATKALTELSLGGYIYRVQGKGSFVNPLGSHISPSQYLQTRVQPDFDKNLPTKIGVIIPQYSDYHSSSIMNGIFKALTFPSYFVNIAHSSNRYEEEFALNYFLQTKHSGIILFPTNYEFYSDIILQMTLNKFPLVLIDRIFPGIHCMSVTCDNPMGCELAVAHLVNLGHQNIAFISDQLCKEQVTQVRQSSYQSSMSTRGLTGISYEDFFNSPNAALMHTDFINRIKKRQITAIIASNANTALLVYQLCMKYELQVPAELSIVCFDNPTFHLQPAADFFTYIEQNSFDMGHQAALMLHQVLTKEEPPNPQQIMLKPQLVKHESSCPPTVS